MLLKRSLLAFAMLFFVSSASLAEDGIVGDWAGELDAGLVKLRLILHVKERDKHLVATLDSVDQFSKDIPVDTVSFDHNVLKFEIQKLHAQFSGKLISANEIAGTFTQGHDLPLTLRRGGELPVAYKRPQEPKAPFPYAAEDVTFANKGAAITLAGTLTIPHGKGPFATVVLITGSGPQDRDEAVFGHKPFWVLADHLSRQGYAVLRVDDRGIGKSGGNFETAASLDFASDVEAAIEYLKSRPEVAKDKIGLMGHSEGGLIAPLIAARSKDVAFIILMAGTGVSGEKILLEQGKLVLEAEGASKKEQDIQTGCQKKMFSILKSVKSKSSAEKQLKSTLENCMKALPEDKRKAALASVPTQVAAVTTPWFRYFMTYEPSVSLKQVQIPVLAINGSMDKQVAPQTNLGAIAQALLSNGNQDVTIALLPGLNHMFQTCKTCAVSEYGKLEETLSPRFLKLVSDWLKAHSW